MVLDVLLRLRASRSPTTGRASARGVLSGRDLIGKLLGVTGTTVALEIEHVTCLADGSPVEHSTDVFLPRSLDLHVVRWLEEAPPVPAIRRRPKNGPI